MQLSLTVKWLKGIEYFYKRQKLEKETLDKSFPPP